MDPTQYVWFHPFIKPINYCWTS